ncbi:DNA-binding LacI/PurR family transcriptional regulator [Kribbella sp. VKM Ac-2571]|uniref:LacI family DNA-binding transcriptional regulator n=1 Tax=Kribbella sp. VKM Ac-2571 TaxID=2512222 RepID=UPI0010D2FE39|nr:LacI family DNA-binding transcriptional regulator [Kribbella sp. VKM Ac-2571]TDO48300.1 DNA-binding LacI/PurR family transcriptional regulator [Kribbella sp. VKM Ac-2571]
MTDVAAAAGVSHQTVSRVLNGSELVRDETRTRVLAAIAELGYRRNNAARMLVTNRSHRIGMISAHLVLHGPSMIAVSVQDAGHKAGYDVSLVAVEDFTAQSLREAVDRLLDEAVEAIVVAVAHREALEQVRSLEMPVPLVVVQGVSDGQRMAVGIDQEAGACLAVEHLLDLGHRHVAHVTGPLEWVEAGQRRAGWRIAHEQRHVLPGPELSGDWSAESGYKAGLRIAADPDVTAVFVANDGMAIGLTYALHEKGRDVPGEISVVGFDNVPEARYLWPALTTVDQEFSLLGRRAVELTLRALGGEVDPSAELIRPALVVRDSTAPPRY